MGVFWEVSIGDFLLVSVFLGGGAAWLTGRATALTWRPLYKLAGYIVCLNCAVRFIHYALFGGTLLSLRFFLVDLAILAVLSLIGFQITRTRQMVEQYSWLYRRTSPLTWGERPAPGAARDG